MADDQPAWRQLVLDGGADACLHWTDPASGLEAAAVIDDCTLGPAAGGIRSLPYPDLAAAARDAAQLARAMTLKCAIAGLDAGGCKIAVREHAGLDRQAAFEVIGRRVEALGGRIHTAGDMGTSQADLEAAARHSRYVHLEESSLSRSAARGVVGCMRACAELRGAALDGLRVLVQGCGSMGAAVARALAAKGAAVVLCDREPRRAVILAGELHATTIAADGALAADVDVVAPCASSGAIDEKTAAAIRAWAVVGAANNVLASAAAGERLAERGVLFVPDIISSAGAVVDGVGRSVMGLDDTRGLIDALADTAKEVLATAQATGRTPSQVAEARARERLEGQR